MSAQTLPKNWIWAINTSQLMSIECGRATGCQLNIVISFWKIRVLWLDIVRLICFLANLEMYGRLWPSLSVTALLSFSCSINQDIVWLFILVMKWNFWGKNRAWYCRSTMTRKTINARIFSMEGEFLVVFKHYKVCALVIEIIIKCVWQCRSFSFRMWPFAVVVLHASTWLVPVWRVMWYKLLQVLVEALEVRHYFNETVMM